MVNRLPLVNDFAMNSRKKMAHDPICMKKGPSVPDDRKSGDLMGSVSAEVVQPSSVLVEP